MWFENVAKSKIHVFLRQFCIFVNQNDKKISKS